MYYRNGRHHIAYNETTPIQTVCFVGIRSMFALISVSKLQFCYSYLHFVHAF